MPFRPNPNDTISITDTTYTFTEHPAAPGMAYGQAGRRGTVYQLADEKGGLWALKVFFPQYREPRLAGQAERLQALAALPGLRAAERAVLTSSQHRSLIRKHLDLAYAVQMPWITGRTWMEVVLSKDVLSPLEALQRASALAFALVGMEERGLAHCDLSGPNVILPPDGGAELVDLEEMYGPDLMKPEQLPGGSPGYAHRTAPQGLWNSRADRFSGAVLLGEMLGWCDERVVNGSWGEGYFQPEEMGEESERTRLLRQVLVERWGQEPAELFGRAWAADTLAMMPTFNEWAAVLPEDAQGAQLEGETAREGSLVSPRVEDISLALVRAQRMMQEGKRDQALGLYRQIIKDAEPDLRTELRGLVSSIESETAETPSDAWICSVCGKQVSAVVSVCAYCEKGERPRDAGESISAGAIISGHGHALPSGNVESLITDGLASSSAGKRDSSGTSDTLKTSRSGTWWHYAGLLGLGAAVHYIINLLLGHLSVPNSWFYRTSYFGLMVYWGFLIRRFDTRFTWKHMFGFAASIFLVNEIFDEFVIPALFNSLSNWFFSVGPLWYSVYSLMFYGALILVLGSFLIVSSTFENWKQVRTLVLSAVIFQLLYDWLLKIITHGSEFLWGMQSVIRFTGIGVIVFYCLAEYGEGNMIMKLERRTRLLALSGVMFSSVPFVWYLMGMKYWERALWPAAIGLVLLIISDSYTTEKMEKSGRVWIIPVGWGLAALFVPRHYDISWAGYLAAGLLGGAAMAYGLNWVGMTRRRGAVLSGLWGLLYLLACHSILIDYNGTTSILMHRMVGLHIIPVAIMELFRGLSWAVPTWIVLAVFGAALTLGLLWTWTVNDSQTQQIEV